MTEYHPSEHLLLEYAAGSAPEAQALAVKIHLHYCAECRQRVERLQSIGGYMFDQPAETSDHDRDLLDRIMSRVDSLADPAATQTVEVKKAELGSAPEKQDSPTLSYGDLPPVVGKLIPKAASLQWKRLSKGLKAALLKMGQSEYQVALHKISAGSKVMAHDHRGEEITVVLRGSFSDENGVYRPGDFVFREPGQKHRPMASLNEDCLCLSVEEAPVRLTGFWRIFNPFLRLQPL